jgi:hypothetical protein
MASSSRTLAIGALLLLASTGCWTGRLFEAGRVRESVLEYRSAALDGEQLHLEYTAELVGLHSRRRAPRAATLPLAALRARPELPVDGFPLQRVAPGGFAGRQLPLDVVAPGDPPAAPTDGGPALLVLAEPEGRPPGSVRLCPRPGAPCLPPFHSAALYRDRTAWWVYPLLPFSAALDAVTFPLSMVTVAPFFLLGD